MRELTEEERAVVEARRARFDDFVQERLGVLAEFIRLMELPEPPRVLIEAEKYLPALDQWMATEVIGEEARLWVLLRVGYFVGEYLVQRHGGYWFLNEEPDTKTFGRYVVGRFTRGVASNVAVDPFDVAAEYVGLPPGRSLTVLLDAVEEELRAA